jgi:hypothetical protein
MGTETTGVTPRQQRCAGGRTHGTHIVLSQFNTVGRQAIEDGFPNRRPAESHIRPSQVVGQDVEDVGLIGAGMLGLLNHRCDFGPPEESAWPL